MARLGSRLGAFSRFLAVKLATSLGVVLGAATLVFLVLHVLPGDPVERMLGESADPADKAAMRACLDLDKPLPAQYGVFLSHVVDGTLGYVDCARTTTVASLIAENFPHTLALALASMLVALLLALPLGIASAIKANTLIDDVASTASLVGLAMHNAWLGPLLIIAFAISWPVLPPPGAPDSLAALVLPSIAIGVHLAALLSRMTRAGVLDVLDEDYVRTARAKGLSERAVIGKHVLRNALIPVITIAGLQFGALLAGAIITEKVFARPGIGSLLLEAIDNRNYALVQGCVLCISGCYVVVNLLTDLAYGAVDPRIRAR